jgi:hypothetical protein
MQNVIPALSHAAAFFFWLLFTESVSQSVSLALVAEVQDAEMKDRTESRKAMLRSHRILRHMHGALNIYKNKN